MELAFLHRARNESRKTFLIESVRNRETMQNAWMPRLPLRALPWVESGHSFRASRMTELRFEAWSVGRSQRSHHKGNIVTPTGRSSANCRSPKMQNIHTSEPIADSRASGEQTIFEWCICVYLCNSRILMQLLLCLQTTWTKSDRVTIYYRCLTLLRSIASWIDEFRGPRGVCRCDVYCLAGRFSRLAHKPAIDSGG